MMSPEETHCPVLSLQCEVCIDIGEGSNYQSASLGHLRDHLKTEHSIHCDKIIEDVMEREEKRKSFEVQKHTMLMHTKLGLKKINFTEEDMMVISASPEHYRETITDHVDPSTSSLPVSDFVSIEVIPQDSPVNMESSSESDTPEYSSVPCSVGNSEPTYNTSVGVVKIDRIVEQEETDVNVPPSYSVIQKLMMDTDTLLVPDKEATKESVSVTKNEDPEGLSNFNPSTFVCMTEEGQEESDRPLTIDDSSQDGDYMEETSTQSMSSPSSSSSSEGPSRIVGMVHPIGRVGKQKRRIKQDPLMIKDALKRKISKGGPAKKFKLVFPRNKIPVSEIFRNNPQPVVRQGSWFGRENTVSKINDSAEQSMKNAQEEEMNRRRFIGGDDMNDADHTRVITVVPDCDYDECDDKTKEYTYIKEVKGSYERLCKAEDMELILCKSDNRFHCKVCHQTMDTHELWNKHCAIFHSRAYYYSKILRAKTEAPEDYCVAYMMCNFENKKNFACNKLFRVKTYYNDHVQSYHMFPELKCPMRKKLDCNAVFETSQQRYKHCRTKHGHSFACLKKNYGHPNKVE